MFHNNSHCQRYFVGIGRAIRGNRNAYYHGGCKDAANTIRSTRAIRMWNANFIDRSFN